MRNKETRLKYCNTDFTFIFLPVTKMYFIKSITHNVFSLNISCAVVSLKYFYVVVLCWPSCGVFLYFRGVLGFITAICHSLYIFLSVCLVWSSKSFFFFCGLTGEWYTMEWVWGNSRWRGGHCLGLYPPCGRLETGSLNKNVIDWSLPQAKTNGDGRGHVVLSLVGNPESILNVLKHSCLFIYVFVCHC